MTKLQKSYATLQQENEELRSANEELQDEIIALEATIDEMRSDMEHGASILGN